MRRKIVLCRCEDVTLADVERAIATGFDHIEEVKRHTGFGTGLCQGKECLAAVALAVARACGRAPSTMAPFTSRPPLAPTEMGLLAGPETLDRNAASSGAALATAASAAAASPGAVTSSGAAPAGDARS